MNLVHLIQFSKIKIMGHNKTKKAHTQEKYSKTRHVTKLIKCNFMPILLIFNSIISSSKNLLNIVVTKK